MEQLQMPFNATEMTEKDKNILADKISDGTIEVLLEVRNNKKELMGFQTVLSFDKKSEILQKNLMYLANLNKKFENCKYYERKKLRKQVETLRNIINKIQKIRILLITDGEDISKEFDSFDSYKEEESKIYLLDPDINYYKI